MPLAVAGAESDTLVLSLYVLVKEVVPLPELLLSFGLTVIEIPLLGLDEATDNVLVVTGIA